MTHYDRAPQNIYAEGRPKVRRGKRYARPSQFNGRLAILFDPAALNGRGRGIFLLSASETSPRDACTMAVHGRGILTVTLNGTDAMRLGFGVQGRRPKDTHMPYYTPSVEAVACRETGISAAERATTMRAVAAPAATAASLTSPGHVMVQVVRNVFRTQASLPELGYRLAFTTGAQNALGWCDILDDEGDLAGIDHCFGLAEKLSLLIFNAREVENFTLRPYKIFE